MSGFDENPFGEPKFDNPFADPAIQQVARNTNNTRQDLEDYNPFENDNKKPQDNQNQPAVVPVIQSVPAYTRSGQQYQTNSQTGAEITQITTAELQRRQEELERKAQELERREEELRNLSSTGRRNNWPPLPEKCCFQPCFYQDINIDIPAEFQRIVRHLYYLWMMYALVMCLNVFGGMTLMFTGEFTTFGLGLFYAFIFTPASFLCWYRPAYKAFRSDSSVNFMIFFFVFFFQMIVTIFQTIGIPGSGSCGFILALEQFHKPGGVFYGVLLLIIAIAFAVCAAGDVMLLTKIHAIYRSSGASFAKAQAEFTTEFMRNEHVQSAAQNAASAAINNQFNNAPRY